MQDCCTVYTVRPYDKVTKALNEVQDFFYEKLTNYN